MNRYAEAEALIHAKLKTQSVSELAAELGINSAHISNIATRGISPTLDAAMVTAGLLLPPRKRIRIRADVTPQQRERLHRIASERGMTWGELCRAVADGCLSVS